MLLNGGSSRYLHGLLPTATGLDGISARFLKIGDPFFAAPVADMMNLLLSMGVVPRQWKTTYIIVTSLQNSSSAVSIRLQTSIHHANSPHGLWSALWSRTISSYLSCSFFHQALAYLTNFPFCRAHPKQQPLFISLIIQIPVIFKAILMSCLSMFAHWTFQGFWQRPSQCSKLDKFSRVSTKDHVYNWIEAFFLASFLASAAVSITFEYPPASLPSMTIT
jgi:hypothetical protein